MSMLITGGAGDIGGYVVRELLANRHVIVVVDNRRAAFRAAPLLRPVTR